MDTDETQIKTAEKDYSLKPVTEQIIGAAFEVQCSGLRLFGKGLPAGDAS
ncbi:MAG TPA: hypothetical protein VGM58_07455 [Verrucomicrobiae bacterium]